MSAVGERVRRLLTGEAGPVPALVLAGVAVVISFVAMAGPRAFVVAGNSATRQAVAQASALDTGALVTGDLRAAPGAGVLSAAAIHRVTGSFGAALPLPGLFPASRRWAGTTLPTQTALNAAPSALTPNMPQLEVAYREGLAAYSRVVSGSLPLAPATVKPGTHGSPGSVTITVAVTKAVAARFSLRVGSVLDLGRVSSGGPRTSLRVSGIVQPRLPASAFWLSDRLVSAPLLSGPATSPFWVAGAIAGPGDLTALATAYAGDAEQVSWFFPLTTSLTSADIPHLESGISALASSSRLQTVQAAAHAGSVQHLAITTGLADGLAIFTAQWRSTARADSILAVGLFAAGLVLLLICGGLAVEAYRTELVLLRARGGSLVQLARRMLARSSCIAVPAAAAGSAAAVAAFPGGSGTTGWVLGGLTALTAIFAVPVIAVTTHRRSQPVQAGGGDMRTAQRSVRRLVAEIAIAVVAAAAVADARLRGAGTSTTGPYLSASAVLIAVAIWPMVNRAYRLPLRALAGMAAGRRGPVGSVGLARAAAARSGSVLPALALMLTLTLTVFGAMAMESIATGQQAGSWSQVGADVSIAAKGTSVVTAADIHALQQIPGVRRGTAVFAAQAQGALGVVLASGRQGRPVGLAVVDPVSYAAFSAQTPWPDFPAAALARPRSGHTRAVPVLVSSSLASSAGTADLHLEYFGSNLPVRIVGTIGATGVMPAGGDYVLVPRWAQSRLPSIPSPSTALLAGTSISVSQLQATAAKLLPGSLLTLRSHVLGELTRAPALHLSEQLYLAAVLAAALLTAFAVLFALAGSARGRAMMSTRLAAIGMTRRQAVVLGCADAVPLVSIAIIGTVIASVLLIVVIGPVLGLNVFTGSTVPVALRPTWAGAIIPLAGVAVLAVILLAADGARLGRRDIGAAIRQEEAH